MWNSDRRRVATLLCFVGACLPSLACVEHALMQKFQPTAYPVPLPVEPVEPTDGAIWRGGTASGSFLYFDRKARGVGDLVTVLILENMSAAGSASTSLDKQSSFSADLTSDIGFTQLLQEGAAKLFQIAGIGDGGGDAAPGETVNVVNSSASSGFNGDGETSREGQFTGVVTCQIVEVMPGGVFRIYGRRQLIVNHELQFVTIQGLVRREDISIRNTVASTALADALLTYDGIGVIDDKQRPSLLARLIDWAYPF